MSVTGVPRTPMALMSGTPPKQLEKSFELAKTFINLPKLAKHHEQIHSFRAFISQSFEALFTTTSDTADLAGLEARLTEMTEKYQALLGEYESEKQEDRDLFLIHLFHPHQHRISMLLSLFIEEIKAVKGMNEAQATAAKEAWTRDDSACKTDQDALDATLRRTVQTRGSIANLFALDKARSDEEQRKLEIMLKHSSVDSARSSSERTLFSTAFNLMALKQDWFQNVFPGQTRQAVAGLLEPVADALYQNLRSAGLIDINTWAGLDIESVSMRVLCYIEAKKADSQIVKAFQAALAANGVSIVEVEG